MLSTHKPNDGYSKTQQVFITIFIISNDNNKAPF